MCRRRLACLVALGCLAFAWAEACTVLARGRPIDAADLPPGQQMYILSCASSASRDAVLARLQQLPPTEFRAKRSLAAFPVLTALMSDAAVRWLCAQQDLQRHVSSIELDQPVHLAAA